MHVMRRFGPAVLVLAAAGLLVDTANFAAPAVAASVGSSAAAGDVEHPHSDPRYMPVRTASAVTCTHSNCPGPVHGYWAIDFVGSLGAPVFAAGAGVAHVGRSGAGCVAAREAVTDGNWVWIDHGGGVVTRYHHLDRVLVVDGALVTPETPIGTMGHSGDRYPCTTNYLHFEVRNGGLKGTRVNPGSLRVCINSTLTSFPRYWGVSSWNSLVKGQSRTTSSDVSCAGGAPASTSAPSGYSVTGGSTTATIRWGEPLVRGDQVDEYLITHEVWSPSLKVWHTLTYVKATADASTATIRGLTNGRTYRFRMAAHNTSGWSRWTPHAAVIPAAKPSAPKAGRWMYSTRTKIGYGWWASKAHGAPVTGYTVAIRRRNSGTWTAWTYTTIASSVPSYRWTGLKRGKKYQVKVRAISAVGYSGWSATRSKRTRR